MRYAFIVPEAHLEVAALSHSHLVLTTYYMKSAKYRAFYKAMRERGDFLLLDNSIHEYDYQRSDGWDVLEPIMLDLKPDVVAMPETDWFDSDLLVDNLNWIADFKDVNDQATEFLFVPRSTFVNETIDELHLLLDEDPDQTYVKWLGIHKDMERIAQGNIGGRAALLSILADEFAPFKLWMFGSYKSPTEEAKTYKHHPQVFGNDSSKPWRLASEGRQLNEDKPYPPDFDFDQTISDSRLWYVQEQFKKFLRFCHG